MNKEFVTYNEALSLKELGFDEPCLAFYSPKKELYPVMQEPAKGSYFNNGSFIETLRAPLYQQAFKFFREKYKLHSYIYADYSWNINGGIWDLNEYKNSRYDWDSISFETYEECQLDCLKKLIEIVKINSK